MYELPTVYRVKTRNESHVIPPLDTSDTDQNKLLWHAAVTAYDTGLRIQIGTGTVRTKTGNVWREDTPHWSVQVGNSSAVLDYEQAWIYLSGVFRGAQAASGALNPIQEETDD